MNDSIQFSKWDLNTFIRVNGKNLPGFEKLLESWFDVQKKYCDGVPLDHPWAYSERPQIGLLSNAAVLIGGISFEEWHTEKNSDQGNCYGRNDLWIRLDPPSDKKDYQIEAKFARLTLHRPISNYDQVIVQTMKDAHQCAVRLNPKNGKRLVLSFFALRFENENVESLDNKVQELLLHIQQPNQDGKNFDAIAAIWQDANDFQIARKERKQLAKEWDNNDVGMILLANCI
jgi:hypothetical protein